MKYNFCPTLVPRRFFFAKTGGCIPGTIFDLVPLQYYISTMWSFRIPIQNYVYHWKMENYQILQISELFGSNFQDTIRMKIKCYPELYHLKDQKKKNKVRKQLH